MIRDRVYLFCRFPSGSGFASCGSVVPTLTALDSVPRESLRCCVNTSNIVTHSKPSAWWFWDQIKSQLTPLLPVYGRGNQFFLESGFLTQGQGTVSPRFAWAECEGTISSASCPGKAVGGIGGSGTSRESNPQLARSAVALCYLRKANLQINKTPHFGGPH